MRPGTESSQFLRGFFFLPTVSVRVFCEPLSFSCVCPSSSFGLEGGMWDLIVSIPDH